MGEITNQDIPKFAKMFKVEEEIHSILSVALSCRGLTHKYSMVPHASHKLFPKES